MDENIFFSKKDLKYCGNNVIIGKTVRIRKPQEVEIEDNVIIDDFTYIACGLHLGQYVHISSNCSFIGGAGYVTMEDFSSLATGCRIITGSSNFSEGGLSIATIPEEYSDGVIIKPISIGKYVILGANCVVLPGAVLPEGLTAGACSVLLDKEYKPWSLYIGVPAKFYKTRYKDKIILDAEKIIANSIG